MPGVTLWRQVADQIADEISRGTYATGTKLPAETDIAELYRVNRHTVRRALAALRERGLVRPARGSGTFVEAPRLAYPIGARTRFSQIVGASGRQAGGRLIASAVEPAPPGIARRLGLARGALVVRLELMRHADRVPLCIATTCLCARRFPDAAKIYAAKRSITATLAQLGVKDYRRASTRVTAGAVDLGDAARLDLRPGSPILLVDSVDVDHAGRPVLTTRARFAAERVELVIES
ncbi:MAG: phosphonate metabolism transcriptional regulator PhnF [Rhodoplanes sp.]|uniref:phosphonate metabolism transcriptional regulator PhnF n=1 Tax=Rhodoplanes sp. TaxID=1968906 RepID=UPI001854AFE3|nr:phosphonate metabolism transcriptional regulator PhnF [Rhodoplanes sp.]NVO16227.1 phosphonate metabolism transcriptional regulator PhnF [Rhodoplanes sp.]